MSIKLENTFFFSYFGGENAARSILHFQNSSKLPKKRPAPQQQTKRTVIRCLNEKYFLGNTEWERMVEYAGQGGNLRRQYNKAENAEE